MSSFDGLVAYFAKYVNTQSPQYAMSELDLYMLNSVGDLEDLDGLFPNNAAEGLQTPLKDKLTDCSAAIAILPDASDAITGHTTWRRYYAMLRIYKIYTLPTVMPEAAVVSFSSSPGLLHSKDDFYTTPSLVVMETTNSIFNTTLYDLYITNQSLFTWQRVYAANGWTSSGEAWTAMFAQYNSGTYNNQWMVVDQSRFKVGSGASADFLWIIEQIPGATEAADVTDIMVKNGNFWPSYNIPYFPSIYNASGYPEMLAKYGNDYSYSRCDRALIFRRNQTEAAVNVSTMRALLRYNDYENDPLAKGDPISGSISSRGDLFARSPGPVAFGGVDTKILALSSMGPNGDLAVLAQSGPTHDQQAPFAWADYPSFGTVQRTLVPDVFDFGSYVYKR